MADEEFVDDPIEDGGSQTDDGSGDGLDEVIIEGLDDSEAEESPQAEKEAKQEISVEDFEKLKANYEKASQHIDNLNKALSQTREELKEKKKEAKTDEPQLSKEQLQKLWKEYADDPDTQFQIAQYMAEQAAKGASGKAIETAKITENKKQVDAFVAKNYPDLAVPDSNLRTAVEKTKSEIGLDTHPYGDFLAVGVQTVLNMPQLMQQAYQQGRKDESGGKAEKTRKEIVKESGLTPKGKGSVKSVASNLSESQMESAKRAGLKTPEQIKIFQRIINKGASSVTVGG